MLKDLLKQNRSYRSFDPSVRVSRELLADWIDHARYCPSSVNLQMLKFVPVADAQLCDAILPLTRWAGKLRDTKLPPKGHAPTAYIVICADRAVTPTAEQFKTDVGISALAIMLAASESGYGGCMIGSFDPEKLSVLLSLPETIVPQLVLALGKPDECVTIVPASPDGSVTYYRENGIHYVQKRALEDLIIE